MAAETTVARESSVNPLNAVSSSTRKGGTPGDSISGFSKRSENDEEVTYKFGGDIQYITYNKSGRYKKPYEFQMNGVERGFSFSTDEKSAKEIAKAYTQLSKSGDYYDRDGNEYMHKADYAVERTIKELLVSRTADIEKTFRRHLGLK